MSSQTQLQVKKLNCKEESSNCKSKSFPLFHPRRFLVWMLPSFCVCKACRSAAGKFSPQTVEIAMENAVKFLVKLFCFSSLRKQSSKVPRRMSHHFSPDALQLHVPNFMDFFALCRRLSLTVSSFPFLSELWLFSFNLSCRLLQRCLCRGVVKVVPNEQLYRANIYTRPPPHPQNYPSRGGGV